MKVLGTGFDVLDHLCLLSGKHGLYVAQPIGGRAGSYQFGDWAKAVPFLKDNNWELASKMMTHGYLFMLFDTAKERDRYFWQIVGEKPSKKNTTNPYRGPVQAFAYTAGPDGQGLNENC